MAEFNASTMIDVSDPLTFPTASFTGSIAIESISPDPLTGGPVASSQGVLTVTAYQSGKIAPYMVVSPTGYRKVLVTERLPNVGSELERWRVYTLTAIIDGSITANVLTIPTGGIQYGDLSTSAWNGLDSLAKNLFDVTPRWGLTPLSVDSATGVGTYTVGVNGSAITVNCTTQRWFIVYGPTITQAVPGGTAFTGGEYKRVIPNAGYDQSLILRDLASAAIYLGKKLYFPSGTYLGSPIGQKQVTNAPAVDAAPPLVGAGSSGLLGKRSVIAQRNRFGSALLSVAGVDRYTTLHVPYAEDIRLEDFYVGTVDNSIINCEIYLPPPSASFTGSITANAPAGSTYGNTILTVVSVQEGYINAGAYLTGTGVTSATFASPYILKQLTGTPGGVGTYQLSHAQTVAETSGLRAYGYFGGSYFLTAGRYAKIVNNLIDIPPMYLAIRSLDPINTQINGNKIPYRTDAELTTHVLRVYGGAHGLTERIEVKDNDFAMTCMQSIFLGSNRQAPIRNVFIENNKVSGNTEEGIALDGFGNNVGLIPVICNGRLSSVTNDANGRVVVSMSQMVYTPTLSPANPTLVPVSARVWNLKGYVEGDILTLTAGGAGFYTGVETEGSALFGAGVPAGVRILQQINYDTYPTPGAAGCKYRLSKPFTLGSAGSPVTMQHSDWKKFVFAFSQGTNNDGLLCDIHDFDATNNTLTLALFRPAKLFSTGAGTWAGVHTGFFNGSIKSNKVVCDAKRGQNSQGTEFFGSVSGTTLKTDSVWTSHPALGAGRAVVGVGITALGDVIPNNLLLPGTRIVSGSGATWTLNQAQPSSIPRTTMLAYLPISGSIAGTTLTVTSTTDKILPGGQLRFGGVADGTYIVRQLSGTANGVGTYEVSVSQTLVGATDMWLDLADYSTGISGYQNFFNFEIAFNEVTAPYQGIRLVGGLGASTYHFLAYHNSIHDNVVSLPQVSDSRSLPEAIAIRSPGGVAQRGNRIYQNTVINGYIYLEGAEGSTCENNTFEGSNTGTTRTFSTPVFPTIPA